MRAFIDMTSAGGGSIYIFPSGSGILRKKLGFTFDRDMNFTPEGIPAGIDECALSLPLELLNFRLLELPFRGADRLREVLPYELDGMIIGLPENHVIDVLELGEAGDKQKALAVYIEKSILSKIIGGLSAAGLDPKSATSVDLGYHREKSSSTEELLRLISDASKAPDDIRPERALEEFAHAAVNLRRGDLSYKKESEKVGRSLRLTAALSILIAIALGGSIAWGIVRAVKEIGAVENSINRSYTEIFPEEKIKNPQEITFRLNSHLKELKQKESALRGVSPLNFLMGLNGIWPSNIILSDMTMETGYISLKGESPSLSDVQALKVKLEGMLSEVNISKTEQAASGYIVFTMTAKERT